MTMTTKDGALKLALEALELNCSSQTESPATKAMAAIRAALASKSEALMSVPDGAEQPASKPWVSLTDEEINDLDPYEEIWGLNEVVRAAEAKLREKNA